MIFQKGSSVTVSRRWLKHETVKQKSLLFISYDSSSTSNVCGSYVYFFWVVLIARFLREEVKGGPSKADTCGEIRKLCRCAAGAFVVCSLNRRCSVQNKLYPRVVAHSSEEVGPVRLEVIPPPMC